MSSFQKIIKYCAMAFGLFLAFNIIAGITFGITMLFGVIGGFNDSYNRQEVSFVQEYENIKTLDINLTNAKLDIKQGESIKIEAYGTSNKFEAKQENDKLIIKDENRNWFNNDDIVEVTLYLPEGLLLDEAKIELDINTANIDKLNTNILNLDLGVGEFNFNNITAQNSKIDTGVGTTSITNSKLNKLDLDTGVGNTYIQGEILGNSTIDAEIGKTDVEILGNKEEYRIVADTGIGSIKVENEKLSDEKSWGNGNNLVKVEGRNRRN